MWWRDGVLYQIYPRSFADANGDGIGDLAGLTSRLEYLEWLGVDGIWLTPVTVSPNADWGYDVANYTDVDPALGTLADVDALVAEAGGRGIRVVLDLVPNHTSIEHPWFRERPELYVWADEIPNNWRSVFGGPAWTLDRERGRYYLHLFAREQPDLDWWNEDVRREFDEILRFWFDRGIAGFRIDVAHAIVKDRELRDDVDGRAIHSMNRPEVHDVHRRWRRLADGYDPQRILVGETYVMDVAEMARYYGENDELHLAFNFAFVHAPLEAEALRTIVEATEAAIPAGAWPVWTASNHDVGRLATRWAGGDERKARCALLALVALRGTPVLYYGDELGLPNVEVPESQRRDRAGLTTRDPCRTPMHWTAEPGGGFSDGAEPWLPLGDVAACNVRDQRADPASTLAFTRDLIALRRRTPDLRSAAYESLPAPNGVWAWRRGDGCVVALNLSDDEVGLDPLGSIAIITTRDRDGARFDGRLDPWEGVVVRA